MRKREKKDWIIDADKIEPMQVVGEVSGIDAIDSKIEKLYMTANLPFDIKVILDYAVHLNIPEKTERATWVYELLELDYSLGPGGYALRFNFKRKPYTYGFFQLLKYDGIYRPMKYVYMPFGLSSSPACFSRDIAENGCAHVHECVKDLLAARGLTIHPKATLGKAINKYAGEFDQDTREIIDSVNKIVYGEVKHKFDVELPRLQLLSLAESLAVYFVCRKMGLTLLQQSGTLDDIVTQIKLGASRKGIFIGQDWIMNW